MTELSTVAVDLAILGSRLIGKHTDVDGNQTIRRLEILDLLAGTEMVVDSIHLPGSRIATVVKHERLQLLSQLRIKLGERFGHRALPYAGRAGENNQMSICHICILPLFIGVTK